MLQLVFYSLHYTPVTHVCFSRCVQHERFGGLTVLHWQSASGAESHRQSGCLAFHDTALAGRLWAKKMDEVCLAPCSCCSWSGQVFEPAWCVVYTSDTVNRLTNTRRQERAEWQLLRIFMAVYIGKLLPAVLCHSRVRFASEGFVNLFFLKKSLRQSLSLCQCMFSLLCYLFFC